MRKLEEKEGEELKGQERPKSPPFLHLSFPPLLVDRASK